MPVNPGFVNGFFAQLFAVDWRENGFATTGAWPNIPLFRPLAASRQNGTGIIHESAKNLLF
jgi:hypothetical protein